jgi:arsenate reductase (thioredoxin)
MAESRVLFVCLHGAAKSVIAATHFRRLANGRGLRTDATFAGTEPDPEIAPRVVKELRAEGIDVQGLRPRLVTSEDVASASRIVTLGCDVAGLGPHAPVDRWDDVPAVSDGYEAAREAIDARVARLVDELARQR